MSNENHCVVAGCGSDPDQVVEVDLPAAWEASRGFTTLTVHAVCCEEHGQEVERRVQAMLEARTEFADLVAIIEAATRYERSLELRLEAATA